MRRKISPILILILLLPALTQCAPATKTPEMAASPSPSSPTSLPTEVEQPTETPEPQETETSQGGSALLESSARWRGIGRLNISGTCTAVLIDTEAGSDAPAFILTSGHCIEWLANGAITGRELEGEVLFNYFADSTEAQIAVPLAEIVYSTMQGSDIGIIRLDVTLGKLANQDILPYPIAQTALDADSGVRVIGAPSSGLAPEEAFLREEVCEVRRRVDLLEFNWHFYDHYATSCQDIFGGSSGSPLFSSEENIIYGLVNTTVESESACYLGAPCEIGEGAVSLNKGTSYATPIDGLLTCFDANGSFSLSEGCPLPPPSQLTFAEAPWSASQPPLTWGATLTGDYSFYRYKTGAAGVVNCRSDAGYSAPLVLVDNPTIDDPVPDEEGFYLLCVLAGNTATVDGSWQNPAYPTVAIAEIDTTPPMLEPQLVVRESADYFDISLIFQPPELSDYWYKFGPVETTDCNDEADYIRYFRVAISIEREEAPIKLCVIGFDNANNPTEPLEKILNQ